jgi:hypothetical protein
MNLQHTENLFRRYKGQQVTIKTVSGGIYQGRVTEITNDYLGLLEKEDGEPAQVFLLFHAIESMMVSELPIQ